MFKMARMLSENTKRFYRTVSRVLPPHIRFDLDHTLCSSEKPVFVCFEIQINASIVFGLRI